MMSLAAPLYALSENRIGNDLADLTKIMRQRQMLDLDQSSGLIRESSAYPELIWADDQFGDEWLDFTEQEESDFWSEVFKSNLLTLQ